MAETIVGRDIGLAPYLTIKGGRGAEAVEFYKQAFDAEELVRQGVENSTKLMHAALRINGSLLLLSDDFPEHMGGQESPDPASVTLHLQVDDADVWWRRARDAGATVKMELAEQFWGDRYGQLRDPFGHSWSIGSSKK
ncbi:MAG: glyoxalase/bleomycin resistance/extradiol dioxygenase family protein [Terricaulis sp.]